MQYVYAGPLPNIVYNPLNNSFNVAANEPTNRQNFAVVTLNDTLFLIGGYTTYYPAPDDSLFDIIELATTEQYTPLGYGTQDPAYLAPTAIIPPEITVSSPLNQTYNETSVSLAFSTDKPVNWVSYSLDGQQNVTLTGNTNLTDLPNGLHNITVYSEDTFGNIGSSETITFTVAKPEPSRSFPVVPIVAVSIVAVVLVVVAGSLVYHKKHNAT